MRLFGQAESSAFCLAYIVFTQERRVIMAKIGFIGVGNMGYAIFSKLIEVVDKKDVLFTDVNKSRCQEIAESTGAVYVEDNYNLAKEADYIILAVKPQFFDEVLKDIKDAIDESKVVLSIAAGVTIARIAEGLGGKARVVRSMPNTPAMVGEGMTGVAYDETLFSDEELKVIDTIYTSYGKYSKVPEKLMNVVTCASGSSPAYVYMFIEALADGVVKYGMPRETAYKFVAQTVLGAAKMVLESGEHPGVLKDRVCSPGGTTIAALAALEEEGFRNSIIKATDACYEVGESLSGK